MRPTPYLDGFRAGVKPPPEFDTPNEVPDMQSDSPSPDFEALAKRWRCSARTVRRMFAANVDTEDAVSVGNYLTSVRAPSEDMISAVLEEISDT